MVRMPTPDEIAALRQALSDATARGEQAARRSEELAGEIRVLRTERDLLQEQLNRFKRQLFDAKSEKMGEASAAHQKDLFFNEAEVEGAQAQPAAAETEGEKIDVPAHQRAKRGRKPLDPALPREVRRHELPEDERVCPHDGAALREIGVEVSEQLDIVPQQVRVIRHERVKYACPCCDGGLRLAAKPPQVIPKRLLSEAALSWVITSKYLDGLPLYRQAALLGRFGGTEMSRNTLASSVVRVGQATQPVINLLRDELLDSFVVHGDETEVQVLKEPGRKAQSKSYMWVQMTELSGAKGTGPPIRLFGFSPSRSMQTAKTLYEGMQPGGVLMSDGYGPYAAIAGQHRLVHLGCWAHYLEHGFIWCPMLEIAARSRHRSGGQRQINPTCPMRLGIRSTLIGVCRPHGHIDMHDAATGGHAQRQGHPARVARRSLRWREYRAAIPAVDRPVPTLLPGPRSGRRRPTDARRGQALPGVVRELTQHRNLPAGSCEFVDALVAPCPRGHGHASAAMEAHRTPAAACHCSPARLRCPPWPASGQP
jgi:transposase